MPFNSGSYDFTNVTCPPNSSLEYSVDGGTTWASTEPSYPNSSAEGFDLCVRCACLEGTAVSDTTCVTVASIDPDSCCPTLNAPSAPVVVDSSCT